MCINTTKSRNKYHNVVFMFGGGSTTVGLASIGDNKISVTELDVNFVSE